MNKFKFMTEIRHFIRASVFIYQFACIIRTKKKNKLHNRIFWDDQIADFLGGVLYAKQ